MKKSAFGFWRISKNAGSLITTAGLPAKAHKQICWLKRKGMRILGGAAALILSSSCFANYNCGGAVSYLGIDSGGDVTVALANSTPIHKICNLVTQGSYAVTVPSCKSAYAAFLAAKLSGKAMVVYYFENGLACGTLPSWGQVPAVYFIEGPN